MGNAQVKPMLWLLLVPLSGPAAAHSLTEVTQLAYLTVAPGEVRLELDLSAGIVVTAALLQPLDRDGDKTITDAETQAFARFVLDQSTLTLDGAPAVWTLQTVTAPPYWLLEQAGGGVKITATAARVDSDGEHSLSYRNLFQPAPSLWTANIFLHPGDGWHYAVSDQRHSADGAQLDVAFTASASAP